MSVWRHFERTFKVSPVMRKVANVRYDARMSFAYSPSEVARVLRINEETVRRAIRTNKLSALHVGDQYRLTPTDLGQWIGMDRYLELFRPLEDARRALGSGGLDEDEAYEIALGAVRAIRASTVRFTEGPAPERKRRTKKNSIRAS
jgi:excisionase family DNA binding protein